MKLKLLYPSLKTLQALVATIAVYHKPSALPTELWDWFGKARDAFPLTRANHGTAVQNQAAASMVLFPASPDSLSKEVFDAAYNDSPPVQLIFDNQYGFALSEPPKQRYMLQHHPLFIEHTRLKLWYDASHHNFSLLLLSLP